MDHRIPQVLFPARAVASYPRRIRLNQARLKAEVHVITWNPWSPGPVLFCGLLNFRCDVSCLLSTEDSANLVQLYYTIGKNWKKTCEVVKWCARKTNIPGGPWDLGKLGACDPSQDYKWITVQGLIQNGTVHQPQPILPQSSRTTPNQNPGREYGTRFTSQTYHFFSMFLLT
jgi:hypothetical protein